jgi:hypothetical protein
MSVCRSSWRIIVFVRDQIIESHHIVFYLFPFCSQGILSPKNEEIKIKCLWPWLWALQRFMGLFLALRAPDLLYRLNTPLISDNKILYDDFLSSDLWRRLLFFSYYDKLSLWEGLGRYIGQGPGEPRTDPWISEGPIAIAIDVLFWFFHFLGITTTNWHLSCKSEWVNVCCLTPLSTIVQFISWRSVLLMEKTGGPI